MAMEAAIIRTRHRRLSREPISRYPPPVNSSSRTHSTPFDDERRMAAAALSLRSRLPASGPMIDLSRRGAPFSFWPLPGLDRPWPVGHDETHR